MARFERGSREARERARRAALARWGTRAATPAEIAPRASAQALEDKASARLLEEARLDMLGRFRVQALEAEQAKQRSSAPAPSIASPAIPDSLKGAAPTPPAGGPQVFSHGGAVSPEKSPTSVDSVVDDYLLPRGAVVDLPGGAEAPGSPEPRDLPAGGAGISPQPALPVAGRVEGASLWCRGCGALIRDALHSGHRCPNQPAHVAACWSTKPV